MLKRILARFAAASALWVLASPVPAGAVLLKYSYEGDLFIYAESPFTTSDRVVGWFIIDCAGPSPGGDCEDLEFADYTANVVSFAFSAGPVSFTEASPTSGLQFAFQTGNDTPSSISHWQIGMSGSGSILTEACSGEPPFCPGSENGDSASTSSGGGGALAFNRMSTDFTLPGTWSVASVPLPPPVHFVGSAIAFFAGVTWRRRRATPA